MLPPLKKMKQNLFQGLERKVTSLGIGEHETPLETWRSRQWRRGGVCLLVRELLEVYWRDGLIGGREKPKAQNREELKWNLRFLKESFSERKLLKENWPGPCCSKLSYDNPELVWNFISGLEALKGNVVQIFFFQFVQKRREKIVPERLLNKGIKKPGLKFNPELVLISLWTTGPRIFTYV